MLLKRLKWKSYISFSLHKVFIKAVLSGDTVKKKTQLKFISSWINWSESVVPGTAFWFSKYLTRVVMAMLLSTKNEKISTVKDWFLYILEIAGYQLIKRLDIKSKCYLIIKIYTSVWNYSFLRKSFARKYSFVGSVILKIFM